MPRLRNSTNAQPSKAGRVGDSQAKGAMAAVLEELFQDMYQHRWQIYRMNFIRGLLFGFGGVIGGTIVVALVLWVLSWFDQLPFISNITEAARQSLQQTNPQQ